MCHYPIKVGTFGNKFANDDEISRELDVGDDIAQSWTLFKNGSIILGVRSCANVVVACSRLRKMRIPGSAVDRIDANPLENVHGERHEAMCEFVGVAIDADYETLLEAFNGLVDGANSDSSKYAPTAYDFNEFGDVDQLTGTVVRRKFRKRLAKYVAKRQNCPQMGMKRGSPTTPSVKRGEPGWFEPPSAKRATICGRSTRLASPPNWPRDENASRNDAATANASRSNETASNATRNSRETAANRPTTSWPSNEYDDATANASRIDETAANTARNSRETAANWPS